MVVGHVGLMKSVGFIIVVNGCLTSYGYHPQVAQLQESCSNVNGSKSMKHTKQSDTTACVLQHMVQGPCWCRKEEICIYPHIM